MTRRIAIANNKGGVAKTHTTVNLAYNLAKIYNQKCLIIDTDPSGAVKTYLKLSASNNKRLSALLTTDVDMNEIIVSRPDLPNIDFILGDTTTAAAEMMMNGFPAREKTLKMKVGENDSIYDFVFIDCGPNLSLMIQNSIYYADEMLIPTNMEELALAGVATIVSQMGLTYKFQGRCPSLLGILPTIFEPRLITTKIYYPYAKETYKDKVLPPIYKSADAGKACTKHMMVEEYNPGSRLAFEYRALAHFVMTGSLEKFNEDYSAISSNTISEQSSNNVVEATIQ